MAPRFSRSNIRNRMPARTGSRMLKCEIRSLKPIEFIEYFFALALHLAKGIVTGVDWPNAIVHGITDLLFERKQIVRAM